MGNGFGDQTGKLPDIKTSSEELEKIISRQTEQFIKYVENNEFHLTIVLEKLSLHLISYMQEIAKNLEDKEDYNSLNNYIEIIEKTNLLIKEKNGTIKSIPRWQLNVFRLWVILDIAEKANFSRIGARVDFSFSDQIKNTTQANFSLYDEKDSLENTMTKLKVGINPIMQKILAIEEIQNNFDNFTEHLIQIKNDNLFKRNIESILNGINKAKHSSEIVITFFPLSDLL